MGWSLRYPVGLTTPPDPRAFPGYTLFAPLNGTTVFLVDMHGQIAHTWTTPERVAYAFLLPGGRLLARCNSRHAPRRPFLGTGDSIFELEWDSSVAWAYRNPDLHHDLARLRNGNTLMVTYAPLDRALAERVQGRPLPPDTEMVTDGLIEVTPAGETVWQWAATQALDPDLDMRCPIERRDNDHEWTHANACEELADGNILISFRHTNTVAAIDRGTGRFLWRWGPGEVNHQHNPTEQPGGTVLVFDNGSHRNGVDRSRAVEFDPRTGAIVWAYEGHPENQFHSPVISGAQRLPNGNTLICEGCNGRLFEVTREGETVWEYVVPVFHEMRPMGPINWTFRAHRYAADGPELAGRQPDPAAHALLNSRLAGLHSWGEAMAAARVGRGGH